MRSSLKSASSAVALFVTVVGARVEAAPVKSYLSLGDSRAFGYGDIAHLAPSYGDQGYVRQYADALAAQDGGVRPRVINLAVPGDSTTSFFTGGYVATLLTGGSPTSPVPPSADDQNLTRMVGLNRNYADPTTSQYALMMQTIASERAAGHEISNVTVSIGANDLFAMALSPTFLAGTPAQQQARLIDVLGTIQRNYTQLLTDIRTNLPTANLTLVGQYDPYPAAPGSPFAALAGPAIRALNQVIAGEAAAFGASFADTHTAFQGHEAAYTLIGQADLTGFANAHPNEAGYAVIAQQIQIAQQAQVVPEPGTLLIVGTGFLGLVCAGRRRREVAGGTVR